MHPLGPDSSAAQAAGPGALFRAVAAQAGFLAALMFYAGAVYTNAYYSYFRVPVPGLALGFPDFVLQSLHLVTVPVVAALVLVLMTANWRRLLAVLPVPDRVATAVRTTVTTVARCYLLVLAAGLVLLLFWQQIQPHGWIAPVTLAAGLLLGQARAAYHGHRPTGLRERAVPVFAAGVLLAWAAVLYSAHLGKQDAEYVAGQVVRQPGVVLYSTRPLSLLGRGLLAEDLGERFPFRYRYTGLRLLIERGGRYYLLPVGWQRATDSLYVIRENDNTRVELTAGTQP
ncbi:hypothetical protein ACFW1A_27930 [Kitasatospora sp. NPDC058965]|uniref:hypothetical protein n=1 Tax=Kitasatospora sp. NPDC058965 TaxID=3346682 RepID=UPI0036AF3314